MTDRIGGEITLQIRVRCRLALGTRQRPLHIIKYNESCVVRDEQRSQPKKIPLIFFRTIAGKEPVRE
jgi:hypothetical protein